MRGPSTPIMSCTRAPINALATLLLSGAAMAALCAPAAAQIAPTPQAGRTLDLAPDSPFRDPDTIYLEADELINDELAGMLTATGEVEGRYQDRSLRADRVDYNLATGSVLATGNVVLIDAAGDVQYADKLELSDELQAGTAANFTARLASGATTAARFVTRRENGEVELFNATYTACSLCDASGDTKTPTWRLRARKVRQDEGTRTIRYNDAVFELFGLPVFYTPYLSHPDPSADRASGLLTPGLSGSGARGLTLKLPYYWAIDDYTEATVTPHLFTKINPLLQLQGKRLFATGEIVADGSIGYDTVFDRDGRSLDDPALFVNGEGAADPAGLIGHLYLDGYFRPTGALSYGYSVMTQSDDTLLERYSLPSVFETNGLLSGERRTNTSQAFIALQGRDYRLSATAATYQRLFSRYITNDETDLVRFVDDNDDVLPTILPQIKADLVKTDPVIGGQFQLSGEATYLSRDEGQDYGRSSLTADYQKTWIAPGGLEVKPFIWGRFDSYDIEPDRQGLDVAEGVDSSLSFTRTIGQGGVDIRYPFISRQAGSDTTFLIEPRLQLTQSFGDAKLDAFRDPVTDIFAFEDGQSPELGPAVLFERNKADGFDFFQTGRRIDVGASFTARSTVLGRASELSLFGGQSFADDSDGQFEVGTGLSDDSSEYVGEVGVKFGKNLDALTRLRYDDDAGRFTRIESRLAMRSKYLDVSGSYFNLNSVVSDIVTPLGAPNEEVSGLIRIKPTDRWSLSYRAIRDIDQSVTRRQIATLGYRDDCSRLEIYVSKQDFDNDLIRNDTEVGVRFTLATLGTFN